VDVLRLCGFADGIVNTPIFGHLLSFSGKNGMNFGGRGLDGT
jgi:hypothetical protein